jgi:Domain of unknown function (DUF5107)
MSATLTVTQVVLPTAPVGSSNPLPAIAAMPQAPYEAATEGLPAEMAANIRYGQVTSIHPYLLQDGYDRERTPAPMRVAVLENDQLRAEFALDLGGRLVRLFDKTTGRDLVYRNAIQQPANLALRDAWFSGGAEWNIGMRGHWPLTCSPLYAAEITGADGEPILRMWEYERVRGLILQIDATLDGAALHVRVRVRNPRERETGMYWWTNIAVAQTEGSRVFAPATHAYMTGYDGTLGRVDLTETDPRLPASAPAAADYFFDLAPGLAAGAADAATGTAPSPRPWIAAVDAEGSGLAHVSTARLLGRKLFVWGDTAGGRNWCDWLGGETGAYFEIQAGLAATQYEHLRMPGGATWEWTETFLPLQLADPRLDGAWTEDVAVVGAQVLQTADAAGSAGIERLEAAADLAPDALLSVGSPWGALEQQLAARTGSAFAPLAGVRFVRDGEEGAYWAALLDGAPGAPDAPAGVAEPDASEAPVSYVTGDEWDHLLAEAPATWLTHYHRAVAAQARGEHGTAISHYEASLRHRRNAWALRGLALALRESDGGGTAAQEQGVSRLAEARELAPDLVPLTLELAEALLADGRADEVRTLLGTLPTEMRELGRFRVVEIRAALAAGDRETAGRILEGRFEVPNLREGELSMSALWHEAFPGRPVPAWYDFEMAPEG